MNAVTTARAVEVMPKQNDPSTAGASSPWTKGRWRWRLATNSAAGPAAGTELDRLCVGPPAGTSREVQFRYPGADYELKAVSPPSPDLWRPLLDPSGDLSVDWPRDKESWRRAPRWAWAGRGSRPAAPQDQADEALQDPAGPERQEKAEEGPVDHRV